MKIVFRVDSSTQIGSGHLMRCLTLAERKRKQYQADVIFIMRDLKGSLIDLVEKKGFKSIILPKSNIEYNLDGYEEWLTVPQNVDAEEVKKILQDIGQVDLLIVDSYAIDINWETMVRPFIKQIMVIDDLANRKHDCDILLDQNYLSDVGNKYKGLLSEKCEQLLGIKYLLLREEFYYEKDKLRERNGDIHTILVSFGGSDITNETMKVLLAIKKLNCNNLKVKVVVGSSNIHKEAICDFCNNNQNFEYYCQINNIAQIMAESDLAIGAAGGTTWERCFMELPSIVISIAENQRVGCSKLSNDNIFYYIGDSEQVTDDDIISAINYFKSKNNYFNMVKDMRRIFLDDEPR